MPVEIFELVIKASITENNNSGNGNASNGTGASSSEQSSSDKNKKEIVECVSALMTRKKER